MPIHPHPAPLHWFDRLTLALAALLGAMGVSLAAAEAHLAQASALHSAALLALVALHGTQPDRRQLAMVLEKTCPSDFSEQLSKFRIDASPEIRLSKMTARKMKYGPIEAIAQETWHRFAWAPLFQALVIWTAIFLVLLRWLAPKAPL